MQQPVSHDYSGIAYSLALHYLDSHLLSFIHVTYSFHTWSPQFGILQSQAGQLPNKSIDYTLY